MSKRSASGGRPKMPRISEEMRRWAETLGDDVSEWPGVSSRPMFGLTAFYRDGVIFACLPKTRSIRRPNVIFVKFDPLSPALLRRMTGDPRLEVDVFDARSADARWLAFELNEEDELSDAMWWLGTAYEKAVKVVAVKKVATAAVKTAKVVRKASKVVKNVAKKAAKKAAKASTKTASTKTAKKAAKTASKTVQRR